MHASANYIYIVFAVLYVIYSIIKAGKKVTQNRPTVSPNPPSQTRDEYKPVQPPTASPIPNQGDEMKKMLEEILGKASEKIPEKQIVKPKPEPIKIKPQPAKITAHSKKEKAIASHIPAKIPKTEHKPFFTTEKEKSKNVFAEPIVEEEPVIDFDLRQAVIYSEILKRPQY